jgi:hypothetical protein
LINEGGKVRLFDDYDLFRENKKGMLVDASKIHKIAANQLVEKSREDAKNYSGEYVLIERDEITKNTKEHLYEVLLKISSP